MYCKILEQTGFETIEIEQTRVYRVKDAANFSSATTIDVDAIAPQVNEELLSTSCEP
jgi:hypothetical protein